MKLNQKYCVFLFTRDRKICRTDSVPRPSFTRKWSYTDTLPLLRSLILSLIKVSCTLGWPYT